LAWWHSSTEKQQRSSPALRWDYLARLGPASSMVAIVTVPRWPPHEVKMERGWSAAASNATAFNLEGNAVVAVGLTRRRQAVARALDDRNGGSAVTCGEGDKGEVWRLALSKKNTARWRSLPGNGDSSFRLGAVTMPRFL
jgi:hypothetical protein